MRPHASPGVIRPRIKIVIAAVFSMCAGVTLVGAFAPRAFLGLSTPELALILGMLAFPLATLVWLAVERRGAGGNTGAGSASEPAPGASAEQAMAPHSTHVPAHLPRAQTHGPTKRQPRSAEHRSHELA
ncbi:MAG: hypothetical protein AB7K52_08785 [Phycisphaerales bacterium]